MVKCTYDSKLHGIASPNTIVINGVCVPNIDPLNKVAVSWQEGKKKKYWCDRFYCRLCLKYSYETPPTPKTWLCPYCWGVCHCSRCLWQDQLNRLWALMFSLEERVDLEQNSLNRLIESNWEVMKKLSSLGDWKRDMKVFLKEID